MNEIRPLSFLSPGNFPDDDPYSGLEDTLRLFEYGERAGFDGAWIRQRHLEHGVSSAAVFLTAASQRTRELTLNREKLAIGGSAGQLLVVYHADRGTTNADKLSLLASYQAGFRTPESPASTDRATATPD